MLDSEFAWDAVLLGTVCCWWITIAPDRFNNYDVLLCHVLLQHLRLCLLPAHVLHWYIGIHVTYLITMSVICSIALHNVHAICCVLLWYVWCIVTFEAVSSRPVYVLDPCDELSCDVNSSLCPWNTTFYCMKLLCLQAHVHGSFCVGTQQILSRGCIVARTRYGPLSVSFWHNRNQTK